MKESIKAKFDDVFAERDARTKAAEAANAAREDARQRAYQDFIQIRNNVIQPAFFEIGEYLKGKGYSSHISTEDATSASDGKLPSITLHFYTGPRPQDIMKWPHFKVTGYPASNEISFYQSTFQGTGRGGTAGSIGGKFPLTKITEDFVSQQFVTVLKTLLA